MWPFDRRPASIAALDPDSDRWEIKQGTFDGRPIVIRKNVSAKRWKGHPELGMKLSFAIPLKIRNDGGMPDSAENRAVGRIEELLLREVLADFTCIQVLAITTGTFKEFVFYIRPGPDPAVTHRRISQQVTSHEVQAVAVVEPDWATYASV